MNIHHLELFYYVAKHGGIMEGVRHIPYGIQQPAVSAQIAQLEDSLGVALFHRRPFALTPPGAKLYQFIKPFFDNLDTIAAELSGGSTRQFRFGASATVLRDYFPDFMDAASKKFPNLRLFLREGHQPQVMEWLHQQEIDMAVTVLDGKPPTGTRAAPLVDLPLVLLITKDSRYTTAKQLWDCDRIAEPLISLPAHEGIARHFQQGLHRLGVDWFPSIEVSTLDLIESYVNSGYGFGVSIANPVHRHAPNIRALPLDGFPPVTIAALWQGRLTDVMQAFLDAMQHRAQKLKT